MRNAPKNSRTSDAPPRGDDVALISKYGAPSIQADNARTKRSAPRIERRPRESPVKNCPRAGKNKTLSAIRPGENMSPPAYTAIVFGVNRPTNVSQIAKWWGDRPPTPSFAGRCRARARRWAGISRAAAMLLVDTAMLLVPLARRIDW